MTKEFKNKKGNYLFTPLALATRQWSLKARISQWYVDYEINNTASSTVNLFFLKKYNLMHLLSCQTLKLRTDLKFHILSFSKRLMY